MADDPVARSLARGIIERLRIQRPEEIDIELIAGHHRLLVERRELQHEEGRLVRQDKFGIITVAESAYRSKKWRFVVAHEIGHFLRHKRVNQLDLCTDADLGNWYSTSGREPEANTFAAELLMPDALFRKRCDRKKPSLKDIRALAEEFQTSLTATAIRFVQLAPEPCAVVLSRDAVVVRVTWNDDFKIGIRKGTRLTNRTYAGDIVAGTFVHDFLQSVDGEAWSSSPWADKYDLHEHSMSIGHGTVLSFLWHPYR
ncbi:MAG: ImmA/IrrE family metallo-endopeptidase [Sandaracinus sp.]